jgi:hypothetical protein
MVIVRTSAFHSFTSEIVGLILSQRYRVYRAKVVGFLWVLQFPPTENVDRVGWPLTDPSTVAMLRDQTYLLTCLLAYLLTSN